MSGRLFIISGPSGAGKSSLCQALLERCPRLRLAVSCTTRQPRPGEKDGVNYHFLDAASFDDAIARDDFLEWAHVHGQRYGTRRSDVLASMAAGEDVLLEIDWQGAATVAAKLPEAVRIFILPPDLATLRQRLQARAQDDASVIERRVQAAEEEISHANEAHYQLVNDDFDATLAQLMKIITA